MISDCIGVGVRGVSGFKVMLVAFKKQIHVPDTSSTYFYFVGVDILTHNLWPEGPGSPQFNVGVEIWIQSLWPVGPGSPQFNVGVEIWIQSLWPVGPGSPQFSVGVDVVDCACTDGCITTSDTNANMIITIINDFFISSPLPLGNIYDFYQICVLHEHRTFK